VHSTVTTLWPGQPQGAWRARCGAAFDRRVVATECAYVHSTVTTLVTVRTGAAVAHAGRRARAARWRAGV